MKIVTVLPVNDTHKALLEQSAPNAEFLYIPVEQVKKEDVFDADIIIGNVPASYIQGSKSLQLMQLNSAGTDGYLQNFPSQATLCNATGAYGLAISEHMIGTLLAIQKHLCLYRDNQNQGLWRDEGPVTSIWNSTTLVVGLGDIGSEFAVRMHALGSKVYGVRRSAGTAPDYMEAVYTLDQLDELLPKADIVALSLPGTPETYHLFDQEKLSKMKQGSILLNVGRGSAIDPDALLHALQYGPLSGASIDVTEPEPLPVDSPLWKQPNLLITPHISGQYHLQETFERIIRIAAYNINAHITHSPYKNVVDFKTGYRSRIE
ncbi:MAG: D-2-hydroxyacid dehydrogenase [Lachnospiraceae bacterium]